MSRDLGRDVPDLGKLSARKLWADFSFPTSKVPTAKTTTPAALQIGCCSAV